MAKISIPHQSGGAEMRTRTQIRRSSLFPALCCALLLMVSVLAAAAPQPSRAKGEVPFRASFDTEFQVTSGPPILNITVQGDGNGLHIGKSKTFTTNQVVNLVTGTATATYTVIAANGDTVVFQDEFNVVPTSNGVTFEGTYEIIGGTGRFSGATGHGVLTGSAVFTGPNTGVGEFTFEGFISSPGSL